MASVGNALEGPVEMMPPHLVRPSAHVWSVVRLETPALPTMWMEAVPPVLVAVGGADRVLDEVAELVFRLPALAVLAELLSSSDAALSRVELAEAPEVALEELLAESEADRLFALDPAALLAPELLSLDVPLLVVRDALPPLKSMLENTFDSIFYALMFVRVIISSMTRKGATCVLVDCVF